MRIPAVLVALWVIVTFPTAAIAAPILLDQHYEPAIGSGSLNVQIDQSVVQTFTVGIDGILSSVEVQLARGNPAPAEGITLSIVDASGGTPNLSAVLASAFISPSQISTAYAFVSVDLSAAMLDVAMGQQLGIYLTSLAPNGSGINPYAWFGDSAGLYAGGAGYIRTSPTLRDFGFRTFVDTQNVQQAPEPTSLALLGLGLVGVVCRAAKRRRTVTG